MQENGEKTAIDHLKRIQAIEINHLEEIQKIKINSLKEEIIYLQRNRAKEQQRISDLEQELHEELKKYVQPKTVTPDDQCYICLKTVEELEENRRLLLCCGAVACQDCIKNPRTKTCGMCRKIIKSYIKPQNTKELHDAATDTHDA